MPLRKRLGSPVFLLAAAPLTIAPPGEHVEGTAVAASPLGISMDEGHIPVHTWTVERHPEPVEK